MGWVKTSQKGDAAISGRNSHASTLCRTRRIRRLLSLLLFAFFFFLPLPWFLTATSHRTRHALTWRRRETRPSIFRHLPLPHAALQKNSYRTSLNISESTQRIYYLSPRSFTLSRLRLVLLSLADCISDVYRYTFIMHVKQPDSFSDYTSFRSRILAAFCFPLVRVANTESRLLFPFRVLATIHT